MSQKLVILSDKWGAKKGLWITSYLGYLQQYFDITYHDIQQLSNVDIVVPTSENIQRAFVEGGIETAVAHLTKKETEPAHYLGFGIGGTIAWKAGLKGLPMKSLYTISSTRIRPKLDWHQKLGLDHNLVAGFGRTMYTDQKVIDKVSLDLLKAVTQKPEVAKTYEIKIA